MSKILVDTIDTRSGTTNLTIGSTNSSQITLKSGATLTNFPDNTPAFQAYFTGSQNLSQSTITKIPFNTEAFDTDSNYDHSTNYRFTPTTAGKYHIYAEVGYGRDTSNVFNAGQIHIYKNGSRVAFQQYSLNTVQNYMMQSVSSTIDFNGSSDYVESYILVSTTSGTPRIDAGEDYCRFGGFKLIGV